MSFARYAPHLAASFCLAAAASAQATIVINSTLSSVTANVDVRVLQEQFTLDSVAPNLSSITRSVTGTVASVTSSALATAVQDDSFTVGAGGITLTRHASAVIDGYGYGTAQAIAALSINFTVTGQAETVGGQLIDGAFSAHRIAGAPASPSWVFGVGVAQIGAHLPGSMGTMTLQPGTYTGNTYSLVQQSNCFDGSVDSPCGFGGSDSSTMSLMFSNAVFGPGATQQNPLLPNAGATPPGGGMGFVGVHGGAWFDPPLAGGFDFKTTDGAKFTKILGFPTGFTGSFEVLADGSSLGFFGSNDALDFVGRLGHAVGSFSIRNIVPGVDPGSPTAFPMALDFDQELASFTMTPLSAVPEPANAALLLAGLWTFGLARRRRLRRA